MWQNQRWQQRLKGERADEQAWEAADQDAGQGAGWQAFEGGDQEAEGQASDRPRPIGWPESTRPWGERQKGPVDQEAVRRQERELLMSEPSLFDMEARLVEQLKKGLESPEASLYGEFASSGAERLLWPPKAMAQKRLFLFCRLMGQSAQWARFKQGGWQRAALPSCLARPSKSPPGSTKQGGFACREGRAGGARRVGGRERGGQHDWEAGRRE